MLGTSPDQGLTVKDFHPHQNFIDPRDVFPSRSRQSRFKPPPKQQQQFEFGLGNQHRYGCCSPDDKPKAGCVNINEAESAACCGSGPSSPQSCGGDCDQCEDCLEDHQLCPEPDDCIKDCDECLDEHEQACGQHGQVCLDTSDDCDFSCFDCVDWTEFEKDKSLGLSYSVPLLGQENEFDIDLSSLDLKTDMSGLSNSVSPHEPTSMFGTPAPPINYAMHHQCMDSIYWNSLMQSQICPGDGMMGLQGSMPGWPQPMPQFGCHPATLHTMQHQQQLPPMVTQQSADSAFLQPALDPTVLQEAPSSADTLVCQWLMPCGTTCSATFACLADLKKHLKSAHCVKGITTCSWADCSANFGSEAALTGHISKKHLAAANAHDDSGPFKCTFPGCNKSFMYKQVLMSHLASHSGENKAYCHICDQFLNAEGSNFRRHMASHRPKHEHLICKWHHLGCKRRFPRLDNLRRHEGCCKYGKKAAMHHHHYHLHNKEGTPH
jgi:hypothetical protein